MSDIQTIRQNTQIRKTKEYINTYSEIFVMNAATVKATESKKKLQGLQKIQKNIWSY